MFGRRVEVLLYYVKALENGKSLEGFKEEGASELNLEDEGSSGATF